MAVRVEHRLVVGAVAAGEPREVGVLVPLRVVPHRPGQRRERLGQDQISLGTGRNGLAIVVEDVVHVPGYGRSGRSGLERLDSRDRISPRRAGLGLPVRVDHRDAPAEVPGRPGERLTVERFTLDRDQLQVGQRVLGGQLVAVLAQHAQQRRGAEDLRDVVLLADLVEARVAGGVHRALEAGHGDAVGQSSDDGLDRERQPADVGRHPVDVCVLRADLPADVGPGAEQEAGHAVHDALRPGLGPAGEDQERGVVGLERDSRNSVRGEAERVGVGDLAVLQRRPRPVRSTTMVCSTASPRHARRAACPAAARAGRAGRTRRGRSLPWPGKPPAGSARRPGRTPRTGWCRWRRSGCRRGRR